MLHKIEKCKIHQEQAIALEYRNSLDQHYEMMCEYCCIEKCNDGNILLLKDVKKINELLQNLQQSKTNNQIEEKIKSLTRMSMIVKQLQEKYCVFFEQILRKINEWIKSVNKQSQINTNKENQINTKLYDSCYGLHKVDEMCCIFQYQQEILADMIKFEQKDLFDSFLDSIISCSEQKNLQQSIKINQNNSGQPSKKTPNLDIICNEHQKEIILFDLNEQSEKEQRAKCIECDPCIFTSLTKIKNLWQNFEKQQYDIIYSFSIQRKNQIEQLKNQLYILKRSIIEKINDLLLQLNKLILSSQDDVENFIKDIGKDWHNLTYFEVIERAEILSKPQLMKKILKELEIKYKMKNWFIDSMAKLKLEDLTQGQLSLTIILQQIQENLNNEEGLGTMTPNGQQQFIGSDQKRTRSNSVSSDTQKVSLKDTQTDQRFKKSHNKHKSLCESQIMQFRLSDKFIFYQLVFSKKQPEWCNAMALSSSGNILVAGCKYVIKIFDLIKGKIVQTFIAKQHSGDVNCLLFSQKEQLFLSGSDDKTIRIWSQSEMPEWKCIQTLRGHSDWVLCLLLNKSESKLYSGSRDNNIKIWARNLESKTFTCMQTLCSHTDAVLGLSLNQNENLLASCSYDKTIIMWEMKESLYIKSQIIQNQNYGNRLVFINDTQILWQPNNSEKPIIYSFDEVKQLFEETNHNIQQLQADDDYLFFPSTRIPSKELILNVHNNYIYIIQQLNKEKFQILQIIEFDDYRRFGTISSDGEYLITWDYATSEIQVRRNVGTSRAQ